MTFDHKAYSKAYHQKHKERLNERSRIYRAENRERISERHKRYYQKNKEKILAKMAQKRLESKKS